MAATDSPLVPSLIDMARKGHLTQAAGHFEGLVQLFDTSGSLTAFLSMIGIVLPPPAPAVAPTAAAAPAAIEPAAAPAAH